MKPGEFVGVDGRTWQTNLVGARRPGGVRIIEPDHPDFPAAVAAAQSLMRPVDLGARAEAIRAALGEERCYTCWFWRCPETNGPDDWCGEYRRSHA